VYRCGAKCDYFAFGALPLGLEPLVAPLALDPPFDLEVLPEALFSSFMHLSRAAPVSPTHLEGVAEAPAEPLLLVLGEVAALSELEPALLLLDCAQAAVPNARNAAVTAALMSFTDMRILRLGGERTGPEDPATKVPAQCSGRRRGSTIFVHIARSPGVRRR
jgi:hypothetical protein